MAMKFGQTCGFVNPKIYVSCLKTENKWGGIIIDRFFIIQRAAWQENADIDIFLNQKITKRSFTSGYRGDYFTTVYKCLNIE